MEGEGWETDWVCQTAAGPEYTAVRPERGNWRKVKRSSSVVFVRQATGSSVKGSGYGREQSEYGFGAFMNIRTVYVAEH